VIAKGLDVVPIPGTTSISRLEENVGAFSVSLNESEISEIESLVPEAVGERYPEAMKSSLFNHRL
jgi:aryl-alcohol dehydrogenase-like predicted oxidoreductase